MGSATDPLSARCYDAATPEPKNNNQRALQQSLRLAPEPEVPLVRAVSRLAWQKGLDLLAAIAGAVSSPPSRATQCRRARRLTCIKCSHDAKAYSCFDE
jgi:starch synthase